MVSGAQLLAGAAADRALQRQPPLAPARGDPEQRRAPGFWPIFTDRLKYLIMPVVITALAEMASWTRYTRNSLILVFIS
jgi:ABC-type dipeptide/oligopeptide/nickel transport system permease component